MNETFLTPTIKPEDDDVERSLRPRNLAEFVGQARIKEPLAISLAATKGREEALDHVLLVGPPGLGKTSLAFIVREELGVGIRCIAGPALERKGDMAAILTSLEPAHSSVIPNIVSENQVLAANTLASITWSFCLAAGASLGGIAAVWLGRDAVFVLNAFSFLLSAWLIRRMSFAEPHAADRPPLRARELVEFTPILDGIRYIRRDPRLFGTVFVKGGLGLLGANNVLLPILGERVFPVKLAGLDHSRAALLGMSMLMGARGAGSPLGPPIGAPPGGPVSPGNPAGRAHSRAALLGMSMLMGARGAGSLLGPLIGARWAGESHSRLRTGILAGFVIAAAGYVCLGTSTSLAIAICAVVAAHAGAPPTGSSPARSSRSTPKTASAAASSAPISASACWLCPPAVIWPASPSISASPRAPSRLPSAWSCWSPPRRGPSRSIAPGAGPCSRAAAERADPEGTPVATSASLPALFEECRYEYRHGSLEGRSTTIRKMRLFFALICLTAVAYAQSSTPAITSASPNPIDAGGPAFTLTVSVSAFVPAAVVKWSGTPLVTTYVNDNTLNATVPAVLIAICGKYFLTVTNPQNNAVSNSYPVIVNPVLKSISPNLLPAGSGGTTVTASGLGFSSNVYLTLIASGSRSNLATAYGGPTTLTAFVPASALNGIYPVSLFVAD